MFLHLRMAAEFPPEFTAIPLEDIDPYYQNKKVRNRNFKLNETSSGRTLRMVTKNGKKRNGDQEWGDKNVYGVTLGKRWHNRPNIDRTTKFIF